MLPNGAWLTSRVMPFRGEKWLDAWARTRKADTARQLYLCRRNIADAAKHEHTAFIAAAMAREDASYARRLARSIKGRNGAVAMWEARRAGRRAAMVRRFARMIQRDRERMEANGVWHRDTRRSLTRAWLKHARHDRKRVRATAFVVVALALESGMPQAGPLLVAVAQPAIVSTPGGDARWLSLRIPGSGPKGGRVWFDEAADWTPQQMDFLLEWNAGRAAV